MMEAVFMAFLLEALCCVYLLPQEVSIWSTTFSITCLLVLKSVGCHFGVVPHFQFFRLKVSDDACDYKGAVVYLSLFIDLNLCHLNVVDF